MKKFCKNIGLDKKTLLTMLLGEGKDGGSNSSVKDHQNSTSKELTSITNKEAGGPVNTGIAASFAYNNMATADPEKDAPSSGNQYMSIRNAA
jgi:hypothetical protein